VSREKHYHEIGGIFLILFAVLLLLSLASYNPADIGAFGGRGGIRNFIGPVGAWFSHYLRLAFGISSYLLSLLFANAGLLLIRKEWKDEILERVSAYAILMVTTTAAFNLIVPVPAYRGGGAVGGYIAFFLRSSLGTLGACVVITLMNLIAFMFSGIVTLTQLRTIHLFERLQRLGRMLKNLRSRFTRKPAYPQVTVEKMGKRDGRIPWVTKKRVVVFETEKVEESGRLQELEDMPQKGVRYLEMRHPEAEYTAAVPEEFPVAAVCDNAAAEVADQDRCIALDGVETMEAHWEHPENAMEDEPADECMDEEMPAEVCESPEPVIVMAPRAAAVIAAKAPVRAATDLYDEVPINAEYIIPTSFLTSTVPIDSESWQTEVRRNSTLLVNTLAEFGVDSKVVNVNRGPVITLYEMQIGPGIKVNKIVGLADDIAMALAASRVRVVAPIPGKSAIGVEVPNREREMVTLGDVITSEEYRNHHGSLKVALGKDILGKPVVIDLKKLPHLLIAGATGSGKSVCVNSIITSLVYNYDPSYVRFILIDPKMVELQLYDGSPHLLTPVITDPMNTPLALRWALYEMERRYRLLSELNTRDIERYNQKVVTEGLRMERLPFIVTIIDELADLMMIASKEIEGYITRIAQKARAVGIHLVFATQRPSVDIITGIIKANIPARIAFQVAQKTDSRTIIDQNGAEKLLGRGDMLYQSPMSSFPTRIQGANITEDEIMEVVRHLKKYGKPTYIDIEECIFDEGVSQDPDGVDDELFVEALKIVEETKKASASYLQRRLSIGYNRAARIIEQMEDLGYVGPQQGSKPREVLI
jgi:hypothetical protein